MVKYRISFLLSFLMTIGYAQDQRLVKGKVTNDNGPLNDVAIQIVNKDIATSSSADGSYRIPIETGDILAYNANGMQPVQIKVEDVTRVLNVDLSPKTKKLKNVTVAQGRNKNRSRLGRNNVQKKDLIYTAFGPLNKSTASYTIRTMEADHITQGEYNLFNVLRGRFPGLSFGNGFTRMINRRRNLNPYTSQANFGTVFMRNGAPVTFDVDGQLFTDFPGFIDVQNIERIALIPSLAGTMRYGALGRGGVIVINTRTSGLANSALTDTGTLGNDGSEETVLSEQAVMKSAPTYLKELYEATSLSQAKAVFEGSSKKYNSSPYFTLDAYQYFHDKWKDVAYADKIVESKYGLFENNAVLLKALAYLYESQARYDLAHETLKNVFILRPHYAQSYLDIANSNRNLNRANRAATLYARYFYLLNEGMLQTDSTGFATIIKGDFNNLLALNSINVSDKLRTEKRNEGNNTVGNTRLLFEWNDGEAEFDLQFVSPKNQSYTWKHSLSENPETIRKEKNLGYSCSEYWIDDAFAGTWKINLKYLGNKSLTPTYLKTTIYHDYGSKTQKKEVRVFKLDIKNANRELFQITKVPS